MRYIRDNFRFLYREAEGEVTAKDWLLAVTPLLIVFAVATGGYHIAAQYAHRSLSERAFYDLTAFAANAYLLLYAALVLLLAISWVNLAAKRFRDRGRAAPLGLAGLLPLTALVAGGAQWLQPRVAEVFPRWPVHLVEGAIFIVAIWTALELSDRIPKPRGGR